ncbi:hypothetical protein IWW34DRAFT_642388 [Fusarium oxysporum f. sp. albedinis]|nr:hypothetical protein IWW34DRAFT_642516 [Fusarium oxysporum f. sp. albedinis]KAI3564232.1 hypothetical protein IWW34DRAFT_642388 [Fusarium oxysporum f. sp. albedinis]
MDSHFTFAGNDKHWIDHKLSEISSAPVICSTASYGLATSASTQMSSRNGNVP